MNYAVRISYPAARLASWISSVALDSEKVVLVEHAENVSRVHCHALIWGGKSCKDTYKNWLKKALNIKVTKTDVSFKSSYTPYGGLEEKQVDEGAISYMSKGKYEPAYLKGWTKDEYAALKAKGFDRKDAPKEREKENSYVTVFNQFITYEFNERQELPDDIRCQPMDFYDVKKMAWRFVMNQFKVASPQCLTQYKCIVLTYCFRYDVKIPEKETKFHI